MRLNLTYDCGCLFALDLEPWSNAPDGELRPCRGHGPLAGEAGQPPRRPLSLTYHKEGGGD